jgi:hypothetical protein
VQVIQFPVKNYTERHRSSYEEAGGRWQKGRRKKELYGVGVIAHA